MSFLLIQLKRLRCWRLTRIKPIKLIKEKNLLLRQIVLSLDKTVKDSLQSLLGIGQCQLKVLHGSETSRKRRWKIKQVNEAVLKNPYEAGKSVLDPN